MGPPEAHGPPKVHGPRGHCTPLPPLSVALRVDEYIVASVDEYIVYILSPAWTRGQTVVKTTTVCPLVLAGDNI